MDRLPIRVRLTAAFALAMLLVLVAAASFVYVRQRSALTETIDHGLERRSDDVAAVIGGSEAGLAYAGRGRLTDREDTFIQDIHAAIEYYAQLTLAVVDGGYDESFDPRHRAIVMLEKGKKTVVPIEGMREDLVSES